MKEKWEIILSGVGGQGLVLSGSLLGEIAAVNDRKYAVLTTAYGTEARGTFTKSDVIVSSKPIYFPEVLKPDLVVALAQVAYDRYVSVVDESATLVYDSDLVTEVKESKAKQYGFPFTRLAREMGRESMANMIALGTIIKLTGVVDHEAYYSLIEERFAENPKVVELNRKMFDKGMSLV
jgi:2-oxoglutarate ferredoxin oxidoreductase subunit gamma